MVGHLLSREGDDSECPGYDLGFLACSSRVHDQKVLVLRLLEPLLRWERPPTSKAALRPGTSAVVKRSAGLDGVAVSPLGSVVMPGPASFQPT